MGKKIDKMSPEEKRKRRWAQYDKERKEREAVEKELLQESKLRYFRVLISNYLLFIALPVAITISCYKWKIKSPWIFIAALLLFCILLFLHHSERIRSDEIKSRHLYQDASLVMKVLSVIGIVIFAGLVTAAYFLT